MFRGVSAACARRQGTARDSREASRCARGSPARGRSGRAGLRRHHCGSVALPARLPARRVGADPGAPHGAVVVQSRDPARCSGCSSGSPTMSTSTAAAASSSRPRSARMRRSSTASCSRGRAASSSFGMRRAGTTLTARAIGVSRGRPAARARRLLALMPAHGEHVPVLLEEAVAALAVRRGRHVRRRNVRTRRPRAAHPRRARAGGPPRRARPRSRDGRRGGRDRGPALRVPARVVLRAATGARRARPSSASTACSSTSACRRRRSTIRRAASRCAPTARSTCGWIPRAASPRPQFIARADVRELTEVIRDYGEERFAQSIARAIVAARAVAPVVSTRQLAALVAQAVRTRPRGDRSQDPATRTFQALRIHVNRELAELALTLPRAVRLLAPGGRLAVISFHSLEDRIVKRFFAAASQPCGGDPRLARFAIADAALPGSAARARGSRDPRRPQREVAANPRARSATLRVAERTSHAIPAGFDRRRPAELAMLRLNVFLLAVLVVLRTLARHLAPPGAQALRRARAHTRLRRAASRPSTDSCSSSSRRGRRPRASRRSRAARSASSCPRPRGSRWCRREGLDERRTAAPRRSPPRGEAARSAAPGGSHSARSTARAAAIPRGHRVRRARARVRRACRALALAAGLRPRVPAGAGQRALQPRARGARAPRAHRRSAGRAARDLDTGQVAVGLSREARRLAAAAGEARRRARDARRLRSRASSMPTTTSCSSRGSSRPRSPTARWRSASRA